MWTPNCLPVWPSCDDSNYIWTVAMKIRKLGGWLSQCVPSLCFEPCHFWDASLLFAFFLPDAIISIHVLSQSSHRESGHMFFSPQNHTAMPHPYVQGLARCLGGPTGIAVKLEPQLWKDWASQVSSQLPNIHGIPMDTSGYQWISYVDAYQSTTPFRNWNGLTLLICIYRKGRTKS